MILTPEQITEIRERWGGKARILRPVSDTVRRGYITPTVNAAWVEDAVSREDMPVLLASHDELVALVRESAEAIAAYEASQKRLEADDYYFVREAARIKMYKSLAKIRAAGLLS